MSLDNRIRSVLDHEARTVETPWPPPLDDLLVGGQAELRHRRRRRLLTGALAGSIVLVVSTASLLATGPDKGPDAPVAQQSGQQLADLPVGEPPRSLYCMGGVVRWGDETLPMSDGSCAWPDRLAQVGDSAIAVDGASVTLFDHAGSHPLAVQADSHSSPVVFSPDGRIAALVLLDRVDGRQLIVLWDTVRRVEWQRVVAPTPDLLNLEGIDAAGRVYLTSVGAPGSATRIWIWPSQEPGSRFRRVTGLGNFVTVADVPPDGLAVLKTLDDGGRTDDDASWSGREGVAVWGTVTDEGRFVLGDADSVRQVAWSPDRSHYLATSLSGVSVHHETGRREAVLRVPDDVRVAGDASWETEERVLIPVEGAIGPAIAVAVLRCAVETERCEVATRGRQDVMLPRGGDVYGPS